MRKQYLSLIYLCLIFLFACQKESTDESSNSTANPTSNLFVEKAGADSGIIFSNELKPTVALNILEYLYYYNGGGVAVGDINNDGLEDIILTGNETADKLFLNKGGLQFEDITERSGITTRKDWSSGVTIDDVNGDGWLDIYICKVAPISPKESESHNLLYLNNGDATFTESSKKYGLDFSGYATQASFFDYDQDGDLDVYLLNHSVHSVSSYGKTTKRNKIDALSGDRLLENKISGGEGKFVDVTEQAGIYSSALGYGLAIMTADINNDGWTDIYVGNDFHENDYIYLNNGDKTFTESVASLLNHCSKFTMGVDMSDLNGDGLLDIFTTDMLPYDKKVSLKSGGEDTDQIFKIRNDFGFEDQYARNHFQLQTADQHFTDVALMTNTYATDWSWSVLLQDFDNNGRDDIFISNGIVKRPNDLDYIKYLNQQGAAINKELNQEELDQILAVMPSQKLRNLLFLQKTDLTFSDIDEAAKGKPTFSNGAAYSDLDLDGDLDLIVNNINAPVTLMENKSGQANNFVAFQFKNAMPGKTMKGSMVTVHCNEQAFKKYYTTTKGYQSSSSHALHFGLGNHEKIDSVVIVWPDKSKQVMNNITINKYHELSKTNQNLAYQYFNKTTTSQEVEAFSFRHIENKYDDYNADKLIPELLSREGPAVVYEDFNQDGQRDIFIGGARFQEPKLFIQRNGKFIEQKGNIDLKRDAKYEDVDAVSLDFDKDGDFDLYVVSGGNDEKELDKQLEDRIYLNDGKGNLKRLPLSLPHTNGSTVSVGDFDQDGFDDLFIGARSIPGAYGLSPYSFVLKNKKGFGVEVVKKERYGMITDSQWADIDNDNDLDLVFCGDWMNICVLENKGDGTLEYRSEDLGFGESAGLWNTIYLRDLNEDGHLDIIAGNAGLNFKWKASSENPVKLHVADMDKNGHTEPLIFHRFLTSYMPFMSLDKLVSQVPSVRKQYLNYRDYAEVKEVLDFEQIKKEEIVENKQLTELRSMVYLYENGKYVGTPLPATAQLSSIQDFAFDKDDQLLYVGNHHDYLTELGKNVGNSGGAFSSFDKKTATFSNHRSLPLPHKLNTRSIVPIDGNRFLIISNNDIQYILK